MNIDNVVLVRATSRLPIEGIIIPSCEGKYLTKDNQSFIRGVLRDTLKKELEKQIGRNLNLWNEEDSMYFDNFMMDYYPYSSSYTSTLSFSLNGLAPDDINNTFSTKKMAIIDPIKYHLDKEFVNIDVIDTTIKGRVELSDEAILVIDSVYFLSLPDELKEYLNNRYKIELFSGSLKEAVEDALIKYNYPSLPLIQNREKQDIQDCPLKESMISFQDNFAKTQGISRLKLQHLYMYDNMEEIDQIASEKVKSDFDKSEIIESYYEEKFLMFLINKAEIYNIILNEDEKYYLFSNYSNRKKVLEKLITSLIEICNGLDNFKVIIEEFNQSIINNYITNEEILALQSEARKY